MQQSMNPNKPPTSPGQLKLEDHHSNESSNEITSEHIPGTPFTYRRFNDKHIITMGDYKLTEPFDTREEALSSLQPITWEMIFKVIATAIEIDQKLRTTVPDLTTIKQTLQANPEKLQSPKN